MREQTRAATVVLNRAGRKRTRGTHVERRSLPYHSEIDARNNTFRIQHPSSRGVARRGATLRDGEHSVQVLIVVTRSPASSRRSRDLGLARLRFFPDAMFGTPPPPPPPPSTSSSSSSSFPVRLPRISSHKFYRVSHT